MARTNLLCELQGLKITSCICTRAFAAAAALWRGSRIVCGFVAALAMARALVRLDAAPPARVHAKVVTLQHILLPCLLCEAASAAWLRASPRCCKLADQDRGRMQHC